MAEHDGKRPHEEPKAAGHQIVVDGGDDASHDAGQTRDAQSRHQRLDGGEALAMGIGVVEEAADADGDNRDYQDVEEHANGIDLDDLTCRQFHQQRSHHRGQQGGGTGHANGEGHVAMTEIRHDVARHAAWTAAYEQDAQG